MADRMTPAGRRAHMGRIRAEDTQPEMTVRRMLHALGYRYVLHDARLPGKPDLVFPIMRKVLFVHGCFWHGHDCGRGFRPKTNAEFWKAKIDGNKARDRRNLRLIRASGWSVFTVWECRTQPAKIDALRRRLLAFLGPRLSGARPVRQADQTQAAPG